MKFPAFEPIDLKNTAITVEELHLSKIYPNPDQPRKNFGIHVLEELASSIKQHGVIQPIIVQKQSEDRYEIIAGERRWRASKLAGCTVIPAIVQQNDVDRNIAISLIENIQREQLNPIELAETFQQLNEHHGLSHEAIAKMVGKRRTTVTNLVRLLNLAGEVRALLITGKLEMGHARALLTLPLHQQIQAANTIFEKGMNVRMAEELVRRITLSSQDKAVHENSRTKDAQLSDWEEELTTFFGNRAEIKMTQKGRGKIVLSFASLKHLEKMIDKVREEA